MKNIHEVLLLESILIRNKILWRINSIFIKFSLNALLFMKSWNQCKNPSFLHNAMCIESDHGSTKMRRCLSRFMALYSRWLWSEVWMEIVISIIDHFQKKQFFFNHGISIIDFQSLNFEMIKWSIFFFLNQWICQVATCNMPKAKRKVSLSFFYLFIVTIAERITINKRMTYDFPFSFLFLIDLSLDGFLKTDWSFNRFFDLFQPIIEFFDFFKWSIIY